MEDEPEISINMSFFSQLHGFNWFNGLISLFFSGLIAFLSEIG